MLHHVKVIAAVADARDEGPGRTVLKAQGLPGLESFFEVSITVLDGFGTVLSRVP